MNTIKAILIDPFNKTVTAIDMPNDFDAMKSDFIKCDLAEAVEFGEGVTGWIDEEGLLKNWDDQAFTLISGSVTLAGRIVLTGSDDEGDMADLPEGIDLEFVTSMADFKFIPPQEVRVPGSKFITINPDGTEEVTPLGPDVLTYENH